MKEETTDSIFKDALPLDSVPKGLITELERLKTSAAPLGIACSGGADSVFLVRWFLALFPNLKNQIILLHFNHKTRGNASREDANFVEHFAIQLGLSSFIGEHPEGAEEIAHDEASLRDARMHFFESAWYDKKMGLLMTAHHAEDRVESLLMRLSRASALDGLIAPKALQTFQNGMRIGRPMIALTKTVILQSLKKAGQDWREDASNKQDRYYRNFVRNQLLPLWKQRQQKSLLENISQSLNFMEEDAEVLNNLAAQAVKSINLNDMLFPIHQFQHQPTPILRRCLWMWVNAQQVSNGLTHSQLDRFLKLEIGESIAFSDAWMMKRVTLENLQLQSRQAGEAFYPLKFRLGLTGRIYFPDGKSLRSEHILLSSDLYNRICLGTDDPAKQVHLDLRALGEQASVWIRFWEDGMRYAPLGLHHSKKLKSCFIDRKIESKLRRRLPIICNHEGAILWVPGLLPSETGRVTSHSNDLLRLTYV